MILSILFAVACLLVVLGRANECYFCGTRKLSTKCNRSRLGTRALCDKCWCKGKELP